METRDPKSTIPERLAQIRKAVAEQFPSPTEEDIHFDWVDGSFSDWNKG